MHMAMVVVASSTAVANLLGNLAILLSILFGGILLSIICRMGLFLQVA